MTRTQLAVISFVSAASIGLAVPAQAQSADPKFEIGSSLVGILAELGDDGGGGVAVVVPGGGPIPGAGGGFYSSFFLGRRVAIEPQLNLVFTTDGDDTFHTVTIAANVSYFLRPLNVAAPYVFGGVGTTDSSGSGENPTMANIGAGYRVPIGNSLAVRLDGRYTRMQFDDGGFNLIAFTVSIGGVFGR